MTCLLLEQTGWSEGAQLPPKVRTVWRVPGSGEREASGVNARLVQALVAVVLVVGLALHLAAVGLIGLMVIVLLTAFNGIVEEHKLGHAFEEALLMALLVVFFAIVAVIHEQHLFTPVIDAVLAMESSETGDVLPS